MRSVRWLAGLVRRRTLELVVAAVAVAVAVAFVASLGSFVSRNHAALTTHAASSVPVDWQVQVTPQGDPALVARQIRAVPDVRSMQPVDIAKVDSLQSTSAGAVHTTGAAYVVSLPATYGSTFPGELRRLLGADSGVLLFQQTAANLAAEPGATVRVRTPAGTTSVTVDGVVDMPAEDSFFQVVGLAPGAGASAPPDNVLIVQPQTFASVTGGVTVVHQFHVGFDHSGLPADPQTSAIAIQGRVNNFQAAVAGGALVGDNLGAVLTAAGGDASYANLLFLLLGIPGFALAALVAALVVALRSDRRRREFALLRLRGASTPQLAGIAIGEALATAVLGAGLGVPLAAVALRLAVPGASLVASWTIVAAIGGALLAVATQAAPALRLAFGHARSGVAVEAARSAPPTSPWPLRVGLDVILLAGAAVSFALTARSGYQVVLAPEGIPQTQVDYAALAGPALAWPGLALLVWRVTAWVTSRRTGRWVRRGRVGAPELEAASLRRRRQVVARGAVGLAVAVGLALSTAVFTSTYDAQSRLDVALTVGSDVAVVEPPGATAAPQDATALAQVAGVTGVAPLQHRFGYIGADLQDLFGVQASTFAKVGVLQDAFVPGSTIARSLASLGSTPDGVLLSAETLHDYQLHPGDQITIRLQKGPQGNYRAVGFHVVGQVSEWPTAPKDSFIVANADYITQQTGSDAIGTFLVSTPTPSTTAAAIRAQLGPTSGAQVHDIGSARAQVTSATGLAAADLSGLSRLEWGFGIVLALACSALALLGGILERRRALVLLAALGASIRQRRHFLAVESRAMVCAGIVGGVATGAVISYLLIKVLTGIFDPPPAAAVVPWAYLATLVGLIGLVSVLVVAGVGRLVAHAGPGALRDL